MESKREVMIPILSIIACEMLEGELICIFLKDGSLNKLLVAENRQCFRFVRKLRSKNCHPRFFPLDIPLYVLVLVHTFLQF
jgi:hypothetical protein